MTRAIQLSLLGLVLMCSPASADESSRAEAKRLIRLGAEASDRHDFPFALEHFESAYRLFPSPNLRFNIARVLVNLNRWPAAATTFEQFLEESADGSSRAIKYANTALAECKKRVGTIALTGTTGADILLDGNNVGQTPQDHPLYVDPGEHDLKVSRQDRLPFKTHFTIAAGQQISIDARLVAPQAGQLEARRLTEMATEAANRGDYLIALEHFESAQRFYLSPQLSFNIALSLFKLKRFTEAAIALEKFLAQEMESPTGMTVSEETVDRAHALLEEATKQTGRLLVATKKPGADVTVDGNSVGVTPLSNPIYVGPGDHEIEVTRTGFVGFKQTVWVQLGELKTYSVTLETVEHAARLARWRRLRAPTFLAVGTVAVAAIATGLVASVASPYHQLKNEYAAAPTTKLQSDANTLEARAYAGYALFGIAGGAAIVDAVLWGVALRRERAEKQRLSVSPTLGGISVAGAF